MPRQRENAEFVIEVRDACGRVFRVPVTKEVHKAYFEDIHANENQQRKDFRHGVISYNMICRNDDGPGVEVGDRVLTDHGSSVETVQRRQRVDQLHEIMLDILYDSLDSLGDAENCVL